jgi:hypothetical protein
VFRGCSQHTYQNLSQVDSVVAVKSSLAVLSGPKASEVPKPRGHGYTHARDRAQARATPCLLDNSCMQDYVVLGSRLMAWA